MVLITDSLRKRLALSPYYRRKLLAAGLTAEDLRAETLGYFPITRREELLEHAEEILACSSPDEYSNTHAISSTGTRGMPLSVFRGEADEFRALRIWEAAASAPLPDLLRILFVCTLPEPKEYIATKQIGRFRVEITRVAARRLAELSPNSGNFHIATSTPLGLPAIARSTNIDSLLLIYTTALPLEGTGAVRPHLHCYSMTETGPIAARCERCRGAYHVYPDMLVEAVDGHLCITKLADSVFPLLRYLTDDRGRVTNETAPCGFTGTTIHELQGRKNQTFIHQELADVAT